MSFSTTYDSGYFALVWSDLTPGASLTKSKREVLTEGGAGEPDKLLLCYEGLSNGAPDEKNQFSIGDDLSSAASTPGSWYVEHCRPEWNGPFIQMWVTCAGLYESKPNRLRYLATVETQNAENVTVESTVWPRVSARISSVRCEIDTVIVGSDPATEDVGEEETPSPAPSVRSSDWTSIADPTLHWRNGWVLQDLRSQNLCGLETLWLATYVYQYIYPYTP